MGRTETPAQAKAAGKPKSPFLWPPHQRPTLQTRNVLDHLTDEQKPSVAKKLNAAYALEDHGAAKLALTQVHRELMDLNPQCSSEFGARPGGNADRASSPGSATATQDPGLHQHHRV